MEINPQRLIGNWAEGWALDFHTSESRRITDESGNIIMGDETTAHCRRTLQVKILERTVSS